MMRWFFILSFVWLAGCGKDMPLGPPHSVPVSSVQPTYSPTPIPTPTPTPTPSPSPDGWRVADKVCSGNIPQDKITASYRAWKYLLDPIFVDTGCNLIYKGVYPPDNTGDGGATHYNGLWWFYDNLNHIFLNQANPDCCYTHELGHRFGLPHKLLPDGKMDCRSIMSTCSYYGVTDDDREDLRKVLGIPLNQALDEVPPPVPDPTALSDKISD